MTVRQMVERLGELNPEAMVLPEWEEAFAGFGYKGTPFPVAVYDLEVVYRLLYEEGYSENDADDYVFNELIASSGKEHFPMFLHRPDNDE